LLLRSSTWLFNSTFELGLVEGVTAYLQWSVTRDQYFVFRATPPKQHVRFFGGNSDMASALQEEISIDTCCPDNEISLKLLAAAADEVLVAAARSGDRPAFAELWNRHSNTAFNMAYRITRNSEDAEDVVQEAWMKAYVHLKTFDGRAKFLTWLIRIVINSALMTLRRKRAHPETSMEVTDDGIRHQCQIADKTKNVEELYTRHERALLLRRAIHRLQPALRTVIEIHQSNESSIKETADLAGISVAAAKSRMLRARAKLRRTLT
jgi:RNA polymerase sigma-70 factor, ECF subfamily